MNDKITETLNRYYFDSLYLCLSLLGNYFLFMFFFFSFLWLCSLREQEAFSQPSFILLHDKW